MLRRIAFSLIEVVVVLCIMALLASGSMLVLSAPLRRATHQGVVAEFCDLHLSTRASTQAVPAEMQFDFGNQSISAQKHVMSLPKHYRMKCIIMDGATLDSGVVQVPYARGRCGTYAVCFMTSTSQGKWIVVCGPSGDTQTYDHRDGIQKQFASWASQWAHSN